MVPFIHLHVHSDFSLLSATSTIDQIVQWAKSERMTHIALTDNGNLFGAVEFYQKCTEKGIAPIIGCEFYLAESGRLEKTAAHHGSFPRLVLLAKNNDGYANLIQLSSKGFTEGFYYKPRIDDELLGQYGDNLIALCGGTHGDVGCHIRANRMQRAQERVAFYRDLFPEEHFYLELQDHQTAEEQRINQELHKLAQQFAVPLVATNNTYYSAPADADAHNILLCIQSNRIQKEYGAIMPSKQFYLKRSAEMQALFHEYPEAVANSAKIAERCKVQMQFTGPELPDFAIPQEFSSPADYLKHLSIAGLKQRYTEKDVHTLMERLEYELGVIIKMGFTGYFLIVWDFVRYARKSEIPVGPGRGSGAGSLVAYCLSITDIDPIKYRLIFERFLNPERISMPDFDIDFCYEGRSELIDYVTQKYGSDHVGQIITFGTLGAKAAVRDVARALDIPFGTALEISKLIPFGVDVSLKHAITHEKELKKLIAKDTIYEQLMEISLKLEGIRRHASTHAAGIVIGREALTKYVPLYRDPRSKVITTQFTMEHLERCGLVKMDILGLKTLTLIKNCQQLIHQVDPRFNIDTIPEDDAQTFALFSNGATTAVFQFENSGMQSLLLRAKPERIEDLIALTSLYRPGPMEHIDRYVATKNKQRKPEYIIPQLKDILEETHSVIIYQEQVIEIVRQVAQFTLGQADIMRRAMGKKKAKEMARMKEKFISGAIANNISEKDAEAIYKLITPFAEYGFNKSHAAAYSVLAYRTAYLKAHYPIQFMAANLSNEIGNTDQFHRYIQESKRMGITLIPPDINRSQNEFTVRDGRILYGLNAIKTLGSKAVQEIIHVREQYGPFAQFTNFIAVVNKTIINKKTVEACILSGLFDSIDDNRAHLFTNLDQYIAEANELKSNALSGQKNLFDAEELHSYEYKPCKPFSLEQRVSYEREFLGEYFSGHPLDNHIDLIKKTKPSMLIGSNGWDTNTKHLIIGFVNTVIVKETRNGGVLLIATVEDREGSLEVIKFIDSMSDRETIKQHAVYGMEIQVNQRDLRKQFLVLNSYTPHELHQLLYQSLHIRLNAMPDITQKLQHLRALLLNYPGTCSVLFHFNDAKERSGGVNGSALRASAHIRVTISEALVSTLQHNSLVKRVWWS